MHADIYHVHKVTFVLVGAKTKDFACLNIIKDGLSFESIKWVWFDLSSYPGL